MRIILILCLIVLSSNGVFADVSYYLGYTGGAHVGYDFMDPYGGVIGYLGYEIDYRNIGGDLWTLGIWGAFQRGSTRVEEYTFLSQIGTIACAMGVKLGKGWLISSIGVSAGVLTLGDESRSGSQTTYGAHYIYRIPSGSFRGINLATHMRSQGQGAMVSVGLGYGF